jgi:hypothetical protein
LDNPKQADPAPIDKEIAIAMIAFTGEILSLRDIVTATGATISTVATLSTKAEITPAKRAREITAHFTLGVLSMIRSARREGMRELIKRDTTPMVPVIIMITFQSTAPNIFALGNMPKMTKRVAEARAI